MAIKAHLDEILRARGMTSKELCALVGITEANLSILRSGKAKGIRFATINPARLLGIDNELGSLEVGKKANLILIDDMVNVNKVILEGECVVG